MKGWIDTGRVGGYQGRRTDGEVAGQVFIWTVEWREGGSLSLCNVILDKKDNKCQIESMYVRLSSTKPSSHNPVKGIY